MFSFAILQSVGLVVGASVLGATVIGGLACLRAASLADCAFEAWAAGRHS